MRISMSLRACSRFSKDVEYVLILPKSFWLYNVLYNKYSHKKVTLIQTGTLKDIKTLNLYKNF